MSDARPTTAPSRIAFFRQAFDRLPPQRRWKVVAGGLALGAVIAAPVAALMLFHEGPWTGLAWDTLIRLPIAAVSVSLLVIAIGSARRGRWREAMQLAAVLLVFGFMTLLAWISFAHQAAGVMHLHRIPRAQVQAVSVACHATRDSAAVREIAADLAGAEWYSPESHGWEPYVVVTLSYADGHTDHLALTRVLAEGRLVVRLAGWNAGLAAVPHLAVSLGRAALLEVADRPRLDGKGTFQVIVPSSVCRSS